MSFCRRRNVAGWSGTMKHLHLITRSMPVRAEDGVATLAPKLVVKIQAVVAEVVLPTFNRIIAVVPPAWLPPGWGDDGIYTYTITF